MSQATLTSAVTSVQYLDNISVQAIWTGTPTGTITLQGSLDYARDSYGNVTNSGTWDTFVSATNQPAGSAGSNLFDLNQLSFPYIRLLYTKVSGTGVLNVYVGGKMV